MTFPSAKVTHKTAWAPGGSVSGRPEPLGSLHRGLGDHTPTRCHRSSGQGAGGVTEALSPGSFGKLPHQGCSRLPGKGCLGELVLQRVGVSEDHPQDSLQG